MATTALPTSDLPASIPAPTERAKPAVGTTMALAQLALVVDVLPNPDGSAKDPGGQDHHLMLAISAVIRVLGVLAILPVKSVR